MGRVRPKPYDYVEKKEIDVNGIKIKFDTKEAFSAFLEKNSLFESGAGAYTKKEIIIAWWEGGKPYQLGFKLPSCVPDDYSIIERLNPDRSDPLYLGHVVELPDGKKEYRRKSERVKS